MKTTQEKRKDTLGKDTLCVSSMNTYLKTWMVGTIFHEIVLHRAQNPLKFKIPASIGPSIDIILAGEYTRGGVGFDLQSGSTYK